MGLRGYWRPQKFKEFLKERYFLWYFITHCGQDCFPNEISLLEQKIQNVCEIWKKYELVSLSQGASFPLLYFRCQSSLDWIYYLNYDKQIFKTQSSCQVGLSLAFFLPTVISQPMRRFYLNTQLFCFQRPSWSLVGPFNRWCRHWRLKLWAKWWIEPLRDLKLLRTSPGCIGEPIKR